MSIFTTLRQSAQGGGTLLSDQDQKNIRDPLGLSGSKSPDKPEKTAQQLALEKRQAAALDEEIEESEQRAKLMMRGRLGSNQLLGKSPSTQEARVSRGGGSASSGSSSGLGGSSGGSSSGSGSRAPASLISKTARK